MFIMENNGFLKLPCCPRVVTPDAPETRFCEPIVRPLTTRYVTLPILLRERPTPIDVIIAILMYLGGCKARNCAFFP